MKRIITLIIIAAMPALVISQNLEHYVVSTGGNHNSGSNMSLSSTIGEPINQTFESSDIILTQGFQQPLRMGPFAIGEQENSTIGITAYPNPAKNRVALEINTEQKRELRLDVYNISGEQQAISAETITVNGSKTKTVNFARLAPANYLIRLMTEDGKQLQTVKVQKIK